MLLLGRVFDKVLREDLLHLLRALIQVLLRRRGCLVVAFHEFERERCLLLVELVLVHNCISLLKLPLLCLQFPVELLTLFDAAV